MVGYNLANTAPNIPVNKQQVILANAVLIDSRYRDIHNSESANEDKQIQMLAAQNVLNSVGEIGEHDEDNNTNKLDEHHAHDNDGVTNTKIEDGHVDATSCQPAEDIDSASSLTNTDDVKIGAEVKPSEDGMYLQLHATAQSIDQKLLRLLRDDVWTYANDTSRPSGMYICIKS